MLFCQHMAKLPRIILASDHAGFALKETIKLALQVDGYEVEDMGAFSDEASDYPDFIIPAAEKVALAQDDSVLGMVFGGSGVGECIAANKVPGVRAAVVYDDYTAKMSRVDNDANVLCMGSRTKSGEHKTAIELVRLWLKTPFSKAERHARRLNKISSYESR